MIPAKKSRLFQAYFSWHVRRRFLRRFSAVRVRGLEGLRALAASSPVLLAANHTSWWDSLVFFDVLYRTLDADAFALMDAGNLRKLPFLGWIGGFGVERGDKEDGARVVNYAASLLDRSGRAVVMFPQGAERPVTERPIVFRPGVARIALSAPAAAVVPVALRYEMGKHELPEARVMFGAPVERRGDEASLTSAISAAVTELLDETQRAIHGGEAWPLYLGGKGDAASTKALAVLATRE